MDVNHEYTKLSSETNDKEMFSGYAIDNCFSYLFTATVVHFCNLYWMNRHML